MYGAPSNDRPRHSSRPRASESPDSGRRGAAAPLSGGREPVVYAALDLGTNNCRLMIASLHNSQFRIIEAFSRIVRLGEGLSHSGKLHDRAMDRALKALKICAEKIGKRGVTRIRAVATQACRIAANGRDFIKQVERETGLKLTIITPEEEAHLSVIGCASLLDAREVKPLARAALVIDVGGGSTELSWVDLATSDSHPVPSLLHGPNHALRTSRHLPKPRYWISIPIGVVNLAERFPEPDFVPGPAPVPTSIQTWFEAMVEDVSQAIRDFTAPSPLREAFTCGEAYIVGTSGAITSLAGMHLGLERYDRARVDGLWLNQRDVTSVINRLLSSGKTARELEPCIGRDRADLVLAGAAILEAVQRLWPCERLRVADRGLREGLLISMARQKTRRRRRRGKPAPNAVA